MKAISGFNKNVHIERETCVYVCGERIFVLTVVGYMHLLISFIHKYFLDRFTSHPFFFCFKWVDVNQCLNFRIVFPVFFLTTYFSLSFPLPPYAMVALWPYLEGCVLLSNRLFWVNIGLEQSEYCKKGKKSESVFWMINLHF